LRTRFRLPRPAVRPIDEALRKGRLTARGADRCLRLAWTLADLAGHSRPDDQLVWAALGLRDQGVAA
jgi:magnesium chelatase family protein